MIGIADYGAGNLRSVQAALTRLRLGWKLVARPEDFAGLGGLILPGVGRFGAAARRLREAGLTEPLRHHILSGKPSLGICLGLQLLFEGSDEDPGEEGLGVLPGRIRRLESSRLPHIGWASVETLGKRGPGEAAIFRDMPSRFHAYFAHSYVLPRSEAGANDRIVAALTNCPPEFVSALQAGSLWAVQFHPEKSGEMGSRLLAGFAALTGAPEARFQRDALDEGVGTGDGDGRARPHRIIPCLDIKGERVVKGVRFRDLKDAGDPVERASAYDRDGADEVCFLDVSASQEQRRPLIDLVRRVADELTVPFTVGGGIRTLEQMRELLLAGADRISLGTAAVEDPTLVSRAAQTFGSQFVIVSIDGRRESGRWVATTHGGSRTTGRQVLEWARQVESLGAGEILLNAMDADGTRSGYDIELTRAVSRAVRIPVIASGGAGTPEDMARVLSEGEADAALAASIFHDGSISIRQAKKMLLASGVGVRL